MCGEGEEGKKKISLFFLCLLGLLLLPPPFRSLLLRPPSSHDLPPPAFHSYLLFPSSAVPRRQLPQLLLCLLSRDYPSGSSGGARTNPLRVCQRASSFIWRHERIFASFSLFRPLSAQRLAFYSGLSALPVAPDLVVVVGKEGLPFFTTQLFGAQSLRSRLRPWNALLFSPWRRYACCFAPYANLLWSSFTRRGTGAGKMEKGNVVERRNIKGERGKIVLEQSVASATTGALLRCAFSPETCDISSLTLYG